MRVFFSEENRRHVEMDPELMRSTFKQTEIGYVLTQEVNGYVYLYRDGQPVAEFKKLELKDKS